MQHLAGWPSMTAGKALEIARDPYAALFCLLGVSFTLLVSLLSLPSFKRRFPGDFSAVMAYFASFFILLFALPLAYLGARGEPAPWMLGIRLGDWRLGGILCLIALPVSFLVSYIGSRDPDIKGRYPYSRESMLRMSLFIVYEASYLLFYYVAWEFAFRGVMLFSLAALLPRTLGGAVVAVMCQTLLSTVFHIGHPDSEIGAALLAGIVFGVIAMATGSILYTIFIHALIGILQDCLIYRAQSRSRNQLGTAPSLP
jgi:membrane protease YdiL (CAAX protease family)